ncbi:MAG: LytTR family DNA-binding domain-containing protein [Bacteroidota bacterium]
MKQLLIPTSKGMKSVMAENIIRNRSKQQLLPRIFDNEYPLTVAKVLHWFEGKLPEQYFYRIHRTHIVNRLFVSEISYNSKLTLTNGEQLQASRRKKNIVSLMTERRA